jgi:hypothetical protein
LEIECGNDLPRTHWVRFQSQDERDNDGEKVNFEAYVAVVGRTGLRGRAIMLVLFMPSGVAPSGHAVGTR